MKFSGDIIITDPCYIIKKRKKRPSMNDYPELRGKWSKPFAKFTNEEKLAYAKLEKDEAEWENANPDDWDICECGQDMEALGIKTYFTRDTIYGDWSCTTYNSDTKEKLGNFCADAGLVSVFLLDEVLAYNPDFDYHIKKPWTTTLIKDFDGDISSKVVHYKYTDEGEEFEGEELRIIGKGNINFFTTQTGL